MFEGQKISDSIISIDRHYIRPISVEFGAKVNNIQINGISFIEHLSFRAFNEGIRLKDCIRSSKAYECEGKMRGCRFHLRQQCQQEVLYEIWDIHFLCTQGKGIQG